MDELGAPDDKARRPSFDRRSFVKRVAVGTAFAVPVVSSFSMSGVNTAFAATSTNFKTTTTRRPTTTRHIP
jgi:hypothetical protein